MSTSKINLAIVGVGNCASSLIQGIEYYTQNPDASGLINRHIGVYKASDLNIVSAFDINKNKIGKTVSEAIFAVPNCATIFCRDTNFASLVSPSPHLDGISDNVAGVVNPHDIQKSLDDWKSDIIEELRNKKVDILVSYLPVGSKLASEFYAECCLESGVAFANAIPEFICSDLNWSDKFKQKGIPCTGDDIKSQIGATIVHRALVDLINQRGQFVKNTYQLNVGGNTDFLNMLDQNRLISKRISKTEAVTSQIPYQTETRIGPSDYIPHLKDNKLAYINIQGTQFGGLDFSIELKLSVEDSPNSAGVMMDVIRLLKVAKDNDLSGYQDFSGYYFKHPQKQYRDEVAQGIVTDFLTKYDSNSKN